MEKEIIGYKSGCCPKCGTLIEEWDGNEIDGNRVNYYFTCPTCGGSGCETYLLKFDNINVLINE